MTVFKKEPKSTRPLQWAIFVFLAVTVITFIYQVV